VDPWLGGAPLRVFLSHSAELRQFPVQRSFVAAAEAAVQRARHVPVDMATFGAHDDDPASFCVQQVRSCDVYVGLIGFRYGTPTPERPELSYTELEFEAATLARMPRLIFLLDDNALVPIGMFTDREYGDRQLAFRERLKRETGLITATFGDHAELELLIYQALDRLREPGPGGLWMVPSSPGTVVPRRELTEAALTLVLGRGPRRAQDAGAGEAAGPSPGARRPPVELGGTGRFSLVPPPRETNSGTRPRVVALRGVGGVGKTTLAAEVCRRPEIREAFPGGVLWVTLGESVGGAHLADKINDLCEALSGTRSTFVDPEQAGFRLGELLGEARRLLVVDDVWHRAQLAPFLQGGPGCVRLVTTRMRALPEDTSGVDTIDVPAMLDAEAVRLLTLDLDGLMPPPRLSALPREPTLPPPQVAAPPVPATPSAAGPAEVLEPGQTRRLLDATGRWPVLLRLVNRALCRMVRDGVPPARAADRVLARLARRGPTAFDVTRLEDRGQAVRATLSASLSLLTGDQHERYLELAIFPEDVEIPRYVLDTYWGATGQLEPDEVDDLCQELADLSLVLGYRQAPAALLLQDVLRSYLRAEVSAERQRELNAVLCDALSARLLAPTVDPASLTVLDDDLLVGIDDDPTIPTVDARPAGGVTGMAQPVALAGLPVAEVPGVAGRSGPTGPTGVAAWWELPSTAGYLWTHLVGHLAGAGRTDEAMALVRDLRWTAAKLSAPGLGVAAVDADLARAAELAASDPAPRALRRVLRQTAHLFGPTEPAEALAAVLVSRLDGIPALADARARFAASLSGPRLVNRWSLPDQPPPGLMRVLPGHQRSINAVVIAPTGEWVASAGDDGGVQLWDADATTPRAVLTGHRGAVYACAAFPDGRQLASVGADGVTRVWPADGGPALLELAGHLGPVRGVAVAPSGRWFATGGDDGTVRCWHATGRPGPVLVVTSGRVRAVAVGPDGLLAAGCDDGAIRLFDMRRRGQPAGVLTGHRGPVRQLATSEGSAWLVSVGEDGTARRWDPAAQALVTRHDLDAAGHARGCAVSANGLLIAATAGDGVVRLWETATGAHRRLVGPSGTAAVCAVSPDGSWLVSAGRHGVLRIWDARVTDPDVPVGGRDEGMRACVASHDGRWVVSVGEDATATQWDVMTGEPRAALMGERLSATRGGAIAPDDLWVAVPGPDGGVRLWEPATGATRAVITSPSEVRAYAAGPDGTWLVGACGDGVVRRWDTSSGEWLESFRAWPPPFRRVGGELATTMTPGGEDTVGGGGGRQACVVAPDGTWVAAGGADRDVRVWDGASLEQLAVLSGHDGDVLGLAVAPDGRYLVSTGADHELRVWWADGWRAGPVLTGHSHTVRAAAVSPDGAHLASAGGDGSVRIWETRGWRCVTLMRFDGAARDCAWLPDSRGLTVAASGGLYLYDLVVD
jgi:WD40 repeat protein